MNWIAFKDHLPEDGKIILYGNHRWVETAKYMAENATSFTKKIAYKDITHWCYVELPPVIKLVEQGVVDGK